jgi:hypothetical protein
LNSYFLCLFNRTICPNSVYQIVLTTIEPDIFILQGLEIMAGNNVSNPQDSLELVELSIENKVNSLGFLQ